jgi:hypothetical protein
VLGFAELYPQGLAELEEERAVGTEDHHEQTLLSPEIE